MKSKLVMLVTRIRNNETYSVGTVRVIGKGLLYIIQNKKKMEQGGFDFRTKGCIWAIKWIDSKIVTNLSTAHNSGVISSIKKMLLLLIYYFIS